MSKREDSCSNVGIGRRVAVQRVAVLNPDFFFSTALSGTVNQTHTFGIMICDEDVGLGAGDPALGLIRVNRAGYETASKNYSPRLSRFCRPDIPPPEKASRKAVVYRNLQG